MSAWTPQSFRPPERKLRADTPRLCGDTREASHLIYGILRQIPALGDGPVYPLTFALDTNDLDLSGHLRQTLRIYLVLRGIYGCIISSYPCTAWSEPESAG